LIEDSATYSFEFSLNFKDFSLEQVSGQRVWGWAQARFGTASAFLDRFWIHNYCPLMFMEPSGK